MPNKDLTYNKVDPETVLILSGQTKSAAVSLRGTTICGIYVPSSFTGASISFEASPDGVTFSPIKSPAGTLLSIPVVAGDYASLYPLDFVGIEFLKLVSASAEAADRSIILSLREV